MVTLTAVIITNNAERHLRKALNSLKDFADEIIIVDGGSTDKTLKIAKKAKARIIKQKRGSFSTWRNQGIKEARGEWVLYLDADEQVSPELKKEILNIIHHPPSSILHLMAFAIPRKNIILGREMRYGGWWPDYVKRLFNRKSLICWEGDLHEEPIFKGEMGYLKNPLLHLKHDNLSDMVKKTNKWSEIEAKLLFEAGHPPMVWWRFMRIMFSELWLRLVVKRGFLDGVEGIVYAIYQMWSRFITYAKLWEM